MGNTPILGLPYPDGDDEPDGPSAFYDLASALETGAFAQGGWGPGYGGDNGATTGNNGGTNGSFARLGNHVFYAGRVLFGSNAIAGGGVLTGFNIGGTNNLGLSNGRGRYRVQGGGTWDVVLRPATPSEWQVLISRDSGLAPLNSLGNPPQSSELMFDAHAVIS